MIEQLLSGTGLFFVALVLLGLAALAVRGLSRNAETRRRALVVIALLALVLVLRIILNALPTESMETVIEDGRRVARMVENPTYVVVSVAMLIAGLLALLLTAALLVVDFLMVQRLRIEIPAILRDVAIIALFFTGVLLILYYNTPLDITGLFTTSAVISIVIGLALQDTLGNLFSGLALQTERSFNVGDWVRFGDREGVVVDISWRATKLRTRTNDLVIIPNSLISKDIVINYSRPSRVHGEFANIGVHYRHPPAEVIAAVEEASDQTAGILKRPRIDVRTETFADSAVVYQIKYWIKDYADLEDISNDFMTRIWYAFTRRGIEIPYPMRNVYLRQVTAETERAAAEADDERIYELLRKVEVFAALSEDEARALAPRVRVAPYFAGDTVMRQGEPGDSLYIIDQGRVEVVVSHDGRSERVAALGPGAFLGEMALLTGEQRTATVVALEPSRCFVIDRAAFRDTLHQNPEIAERISETLGRRRAELEATHAALHRAAEEAMEEEKGQILTRIWDFFGFRGSETS
ncbi:MAG: cyclic nucleotide-binding domain-containing protein [Gemmatimonadota bacterium]